MKSRSDKKNTNSPPRLQSKLSVTGRRLVVSAKIVARLLLVLIPISLFTVHIYAVNDANSQAKELSSALHQNSTVEILDRDGELITKIYNSPTQAEYVKLEDVSDYYLKMLTTAEDKSFYSNRGVDYKRTLKCAMTYIIKTDRCGGSTITQQLVKLLLLEENLPIKTGDKRNVIEKSGAFSEIASKYNEILLAQWLTKVATKEEILENYINRLNFANGRYGIESASQGYFGIPASELDIVQSAFLAGIPNSPTKYNPYKAFELTKERQELILQSAYEGDLITLTEYEFAKNSEIQLQNNSISTYAPHFLDHVEIVDGTEKIETTMSLGLYNKTRSIVSQKLADLRKEGVTNAAVVILDAKSGEVLALLGTENYWSDLEGAKVNHATAMRQPGSTFKPFVYALGIKQGLTADSLISDIDRTFESSGRPYIPTNFDQKYHGDVTLRTALANSLNISAVAVQEFVTPAETYELSEKIGLEYLPAQRPELSAALGGFSVSLLDLTNAYRIFPNDGEYLGEPRFLLKEGIQAYVNEQVFGIGSAGVSYVITDILSDSNARRYLFGSYNNLTLPFKASVKTGTSQDYRDSWTIGYTGEFVVGVWIGNSDNSSMQGVAGVDGAASIWHDVMIETYNYYKIEKCTKLCDFLIEKPVYLYDTNTFSPAQYKVLGPI